MPKIEIQYKKYINLKQQISTLEDEMKEIGEVIKQDIIDNGGEIVDTKLGSFFLVRRKRYQYSEAVSVLETTLKDTKKEEEMSGIAEELEPTTSLTFRAKKL